MGENLKFTTEALNQISPSQQTIVHQDDSNCRAERFVAQL